MRIRNAEHVSHDEMRAELSRGGRLVIFHWVLSLVIVSFKIPSGIYFIRDGESAGARGFPYIMLTLVLGWWAVPFGPFRALSCIACNMRGGTDVTVKVLERVPSLYARPTLVTEAAATENFRAHSIEWHTRKNSSSPSQGPFDVATIIEAVAEGGITRNTQVRGGESDAWVPLTDHPVFRGLLPK
jgi:hypothetical protein